MKKIAILLMTTALLGCSGLQLNSKVAEENKTKISETVNFSTEIYGVGSAKITSAGAFIIEEDAKMEALKNLEKKLETQVDVFFNQHMALVDDYTKKVYSLALPDLKKYAINKAIANVEEKTSFANNGRLYTIVTASLEDIFIQTRYTFIEHSVDLINRLDMVKEKVRNSSFIPPIEKFEIAPKEIQIEEGTDDNIIK